MSRHLSCEDQFLRRLGLQFVLAAAVAFAAAPPAHAAERVTLSNGFVEMCNHHGTIDGRVRLYLTAAPPSYIVFPAPDIAGVETVPDPPAAAAPAKPTSAAAPSKLNAADLHEMLVNAGKAHHL